MIGDVVVDKEDGVVFVVCGFVAESEHAFEYLAELFYREVLPLVAPPKADDLQESLGGEGHEAFADGGLGLVFGGLRLRDAEEAVHLDLAGGKFGLCFLCCLTVAALTVAAERFGELACLHLGLDTCGLVGGGRGDTAQLGEL